MPFVKERPCQKKYRTVGTRWQWSQQSIDCDCDWFLFCYSLRRTLLQYSTVLLLLLLLLLLKRAAENKRDNDTWERKTTTTKNRLFPSFTVSSCGCLLLLHKRVRQWCEFTRCWCLLVDLGCRGFGADCEGRNGGCRCVVVCCKCAIDNIEACVPFLAGRLLRTAVQCT